MITKRTIPLNTSYAGKSGMVVDTLSLIYNGAKRSNEKVAVIKVNSSGIGMYYAPRDSHYMILFVGVRGVIYDDVGDSTNWTQKKQYIKPRKPIIDPITSESIENGIDFHLLRLSWPYNQPIKSVVWDVMENYNNSGWVYLVQNIDVPAFTKKIEIDGLYQFKVVAKNFAGISSDFSDVIEHDVFAVVDLLAPINNNIGALIDETIYNKEKAVANLESIQYVLNQIPGGIITLDDMQITDCNTITPTATQCNIVTKRT